MILIVYKWEIKLKLKIVNTKIILSILNNHQLINIILILNIKLIYNINKLILQILNLQIFHNNQFYQNFIILNLIRKFTHSTQLLLRYQQIILNQVLILIIRVNY